MAEAFAKRLRGFLSDGDGPVQFVDAGAGNDTITGGSNSMGNSIGGDIMIAGTTSYNSSSIANDLALESFLAECADTRRHAMPAARGRARALSLG